MGEFRKADAMFRGVNYNKYTSDVIRSAMLQKVVALEGKVDERRVRVTRLLTDHKITSETLADLIIQYMKDQQEGRSRVSYSNSKQSSGGAPLQSSDAVDIPAGTIANLITEKNLIEQENAEVRRINLIVRNLQDSEPAVRADTGQLYQRALIHTLTDDEIEYLGF